MSDSEFFLDFTLELKDMSTKDKLTKQVYGSLLSDNRFSGLSFGTRGGKYFAKFRWSAASAEEAASAAAKALQSFGVTPTLTQPHREA